jgi:hypothetical protein
LDMGERMGCGDLGGGTAPPPVPGLAIAQVNLSAPLRTVFPSSQSRTQKDAACLTFLFSTFLVCLGGAAVLTAMSDDDAKEAEVVLSREQAQMAAVTGSSKSVQMKTKPGMSLAFLDAAVKRKRAEQQQQRGDTSLAVDAAVVAEVAKELDLKNSEAEQLLQQHRGDAMALYLARINSNA